MHITIRAMGADDIEPLDPTLRAAYAVEFSRSAELRRNLALQPDGWLVAERGGEPIGCVGLTSYGAFAYVGLMAVHPHAQRQGVGGLLMARLIELAERRGDVTLALDATPAGAPLYERHGFADHGRAWVYTREGGGAPAMPAGIERARADDLAELAAFDAPIFGAERGRVLAWLLAEQPGRALLARDAGGRVAGYLFAQPQTLGPWAAATPEVAGALLDGGLALLGGAGPRALVADGNPHVAALLGRRGYREQRALRHMRRGPAAPPARRDMYYGQSSFALG